MVSHLTRDFRKCLDKLPDEIRRAAIAVYERWKADPFYPSLEFKEIEGAEGTYSVRIGLHWRALGNRVGEEVTWFWIGSHADYDRLIANL